MPTTPGRRGGALKIVLIVLAALTLLLVVLALLLPTLAAGPVRGIIEQQVAQATGGNASVERVRLTWTGTQTVGPVRVVDRDGREALDATVSIDSGLLSIARLRLGTITVTGSALLVRGEQGEVNLAPAGPRAEKPAPAADEPLSITLPEGLRATLNVEDFVVTVLDEQLARERGIGAFRIPDLDLDAAIDGDNPITLALSAPIREAADLDALEAGARDAGSLTADATLTGLLRNGAFDPAGGTVQLTAAADSISTGLLDALAGQGGRLAEALGPTASARLAATGPVNDLTATLTARTESATADATLRVGDSALTVPEPAVIVLRTQQLAALAPDVRDRLLGGADAPGLDALPEARLRLESLRLPLPADLSALDPGALDLSGASIVLRLEADRLTGRASVPSPEGASIEPFTIEPITLTLTTDALRDGLRLTGGPDITLAGSPAGRLEIDARAGDLLADDGSVRKDLSRVAIEARLAATGLATAVAQPFAELAGLDLTRDVGRSLDLALDARTVPTAAQDAALPDADVTLNARAENLILDGRLEARGGVLRTAGEGVALTLRSLAPTLTGVLADRQAQIETPGWLTLRVTELTAPVGRLGAGDLRGTGAVLVLETGPVAGSIVPGEGQAPTRFRVAPVQLSIAAQNLAEPVRITTAARARGGDAALGSLTADMTLAQLLDSAGAFAGVPGRIDGRIELSRFATPVLQPLVASTGLDLPRDVGPTLDAALVATTTEAAGVAGLPAAEIDLTITAQSLTLSAPIALERGALRTRGEGVRLQSTSVGQIARAFAPDTIQIDPTGSIDATITELVVPIGEDRRPRLGYARARLTATARDLSARFTEQRQTAAGETIPDLALNSLELAAVLPLNGDPRVQFASAMHFGAQKFDARGQMRLAGLLGVTGNGAIEVHPTAAAPVGVVRFENVPTSLVRLAPITINDASGQPVRLSQLASQTVGETMTISFESRPRAEGEAWPLDAALAVRAAGLTVDHAAVLQQRSIEAAATTARLTLQPDALDTLLSAFAPGATSAFESRPRLTAPATVLLEIEPFTIPLTESRLPDVAAMGDRTLAATARIDASTTPLVLAGDPAAGSAPMDLGPLTLENLALRATARLAGLLNEPGGSPQPASASLTGRVLGGAGRVLATLEGRAETGLASGAPAAPITGALTLADLDPALADALAGTPRLVSGALGGTTALTVRTRIDPTRANADKGKRAPVVIEADIASPNLSTTSPAKVWIRTARVDLLEPMAVRWTMPPEWATEFLLGDASSAGARRPSFTKPTRFDATINTLALGLGGGPLRPGVFALDASVTAPEAAIESGAGAPAQFRDLMLSASTPKDGGETIQFALAMTDATGTGEESRVRLSGVLARYADAAGAFSAETATVDLAGRVPGFPTAVVDAFLDQNGLLVDALGPLVTLRVDADDLSRTAGSLSLRMRSPRASAGIAGVVREGVLVTDGTTEIRVSTIVPELSARLVQGVPIAAQFSKTEQDAPATVTAPQLSLPIDGNLANLNGRVRIDPGVLRFRTDSGFQRILKIARQRTEGEIGNRLQPLEVTITNGVLSYDRYPLPLGEYTLEIQGTVNLVAETLDMVVWVPAGAASEDMLGQFNTGLLSALGSRVGTFEQLTMLPFRIKGPLSNPGSPSPDVSLFAKSVPKKLLQTPGNIIQDIGDLLPGNNRRRNE